MELFVGCPFFAPNLGALLWVKLLLRHEHGCRCPGLGTTFRTPVLEARLDKRATLKSRPFGL